MRVELTVVLALVAMAACSGHGDRDKDKPNPSVPPPVGTLVRSDGGVTAVVTGIDPSGMHMDEDTEARPVAPPSSSNRPARPIDVTLRSSPPGANVSVDGQSLGNTPAFWNGMADGHEHEFLFTMRGHAIARYRFVPVSSGVIHARLDPIAEEPDAGVQPPPELVPPGTVTPNAPPTVIKPSPLATPIDAPAAPAPTPTPPTTAPTTPPPGQTPIGPQP